MPVDSLSCPSEADVATLPNCYWALPGDLCEGDGECGTRKTLNNCHLKDDVYRRIACIPGAQLAPPAVAKSPPWETGGNIPIMSNPPNIPTGRRG